MPTAFAAAFKAASMGAAWMGDKIMISKRIATSIAALVVLAASFSAQAADIPRPVYKGIRPVTVAYYNWTGFYMGINGGYGFGTSNWDAPPLSLSPKGGLYGVTLGYNYQIGSWVWGVEGDYDWSSVKESAACYGVFTCETSNTYLATIRGRLGYAFDRWLPYLTGGGAYGDIKASTTNPLFGGSSSSKFGWTFGGGLEYAFLGNWSAKIEYLYVDLGTFDCGMSCGPALTDNVSFKENIVRAGLNYKFSGPTF
jgi:outer membrane immunogenic protein